MPTRVEHEFVVRTIRPGRDHGSRKTTTVGRITMPALRNITGRVVDIFGQVRVPPRTTENPILSPMVQLRWDLPLPLGPAHWQTSHDKAIATLIVRNGEAIAEIAPTIREYTDVNPVEGPNVYAICLLGLDYAGRTNCGEPVTFSIDLSLPEAETLPPPTLPPPDLPPPPIPPDPPDPPEPEEYEPEPIFLLINVTEENTVELRTQQRFTPIYTWRRANVTDGSEPPFREETNEDGTTYEVFDGDYVYGVSCNYLGPDGERYTVEATAEVTIVQGTTYSLSMTATQTRFHLILRAFYRGRIGEEDVIIPDGTLYTWFQERSQLGTSAHPVTFFRAQTPLPGTHNFAVEVGGLRATTSITISDDPVRSRKSVDLVVSLARDASGVWTASLAWTVVGPGTTVAGQVMTGPQTDGVILTNDQRTLALTLPADQESPLTWTITVTYADGDTASDTETVTLPDANELFPCPVAGVTINAESGGRGGVVSGTASWHPNLGSGCGEVLGFIVTTRASIGYFWTINYFGNTVSFDLGETGFEFVSITANNAVRVAFGGFDIQATRRSEFSSSAFVDTFDVAFDPEISFGTIPVTVSTAYRIQTGERVNVPFNYSYSIDNTTGVPLGDQLAIFALGGGVLGAAGAAVGTLVAAPIAGAVGSWGFWYALTGTVTQGGVTAPAIVGVGTALGGAAGAVGGDQAARAITDRFSMGTDTSSIVREGTIDTLQLGRSPIRQLGETTVDVIDFSNIQVTAGQPTRQRTRVRRRTRTRRRPLNVGLTLQRVIRHMEVGVVAFNNVGTSIGVTTSKSFQTRGDALEQNLTFQFLRLEDGIAVFRITLPDILRPNPASAVQHRYGMVLFTDIDNPGGSFRSLERARWTLDTAGTLTAPYLTSGTVRYYCQIAWVEDDDSGFLVPHPSNTITLVDGVEQTA